MKKRIVLGLAVFTSIFLLGGIYLIITIERSTSTLNSLINLHQVEIQRERLLIDAKKVYNSFNLQHTRLAETFDTMTVNMGQVENQANKCLGCHHTAVVTGKLQDLKGQIHRYGAALSGFLALGAKEGSRKEEEKNIVKAGHKLITQLDDMTLLTKARLDKRTQETLKEISDMKTLIFIVIAIGPIIAIVLATVFMRGLTGPLATLLQATRKLKKGDLSFRVQGLTGEFGEMAEAFNEMATSLNEQINKMQRAEQMTMLGEMAASLVHEIKNPLAGIKAAMYVFQEGADIREEEQAILSQVICEVQRIEALMKSLLNFAKPPKLQLLPIKMNDVLDAAFSPSLPISFATHDSEKAIGIVKRFDPNLPLIMADPLEMQQVFLNLIMNALQAMPEGGTITALTRANAAAHEIEIEISDTGKGIPEEVKAKIFQPFFTTKSKGTGLGLPISKQFIEMHGGSISAEQNPAGGTTFRIILPCSQEG